MVLRSRDGVTIRATRRSERDRNGSACAVAPRIRLDPDRSQRFGADARHPRGRGRIASGGFRGEFLYHSQRSPRSSSRRRAHAVLGSAAALLFSDRFLPVAPLELQPKSVFSLSSPEAGSEWFHGMTRAALFSLSLALGAVFTGAARK